MGKSTLTAQLTTGENAVTLTLDDEQTREAAAEDMSWFVAQAGERTLVIDEIQRLPELTLAVKAAIDRDRRPGRFILTGSASLLRARGLADSLAGRVLRLQLFGLSQGERLRHFDDFAEGLSVADAAALASYETSTTRDDYAAMIGRGAYPEAQHLPESVRRRWFEAYLAGIVRRDLGELRREVNPARVDALLRVLAGGQFGELVKARLAQLTSIPAATVTGYLDLLEDVGLLATLPPWTPNLAKREVGRRKAVMLDSGLALRLTRVTAEQLPQLAYGEAFGSFLEAYVAAELLRQRTWSAQEFELFHYRDRAGMEVDLILELTGGRVIGLEVKAATTFRGDDFNGLRFLREKLGDRFVAGVVLNTGVSGYRYGDRLFGLPVDALWSL